MPIASPFNFYLYILVLITIIITIILLKIFKLRKCNDLIKNHSNTLKTNRIKSALKAKNAMEANAVGNLKLLVVYQQQ